MRTKPVVKKSKAVVKKAVKKTSPLLLNHPFRSPELPERIRWSVSSLRLFRKCKRKWFWRYVMRIKSKWRDSNLIIGDQFHESVAKWYLNQRWSQSRLSKFLNQRVDEIMHEIQVAADYYSQDEYDKAETAARTFQGMVLGYADIYQDDLKQWLIDPSDVEAEFIVRLKEYDFFGYIDLIPRDRRTKKRLVVEHKTASRIGDSYVERLPLDTQVRGYIFGAINGLNYTPSEVLYDVVRKCTLKRKSNESQAEFNARIALDYASRPDFYFFREPLKFSLADIKAFEREMEMTYREYCHIIDSYDPLDPRSWVCSDHVCNEFFKTCPYLPICIGGLDRGASNLYTQSATIEESSVDDD